MTLNLLTFLIHLYFVIHYDRGTDGVTVTLALQIADPVRRTSLNLDFEGKVEWNDERSVSDRLSLPASLLNIFLYFFGPGSASFALYMVENRT